jgi:glycine/D-amino acid oxidase-like deaminating enzyme
MARSHNVIIVGNGLFGSIAATVARFNGHHVTVVSSNEANAASLASGCVLAPSWLSSMDKDQITTAMEVLHDHYNVIPISFTSNLLNKQFRASRVDPKAVLVRPDVVGQVQQVHNGRVVLADGTTLQGTVLVAAGVWSSQLLGIPGMRGLWGASLRIKAQLDVPGRIHVYAPYRQAVAYNSSNKEVWMGDGTALIEGTWGAEAPQRITATMERARDLFGLPVTPQSAKVQVGVRPYVEGHKAGYFKQVSPKTWVSTGGAKNGTVLAAWQAHRFVTEALR